MTSSGPCSFALQEEGPSAEEKEFAKAVAAALANSVRNAKLHASVRKGAMTSGWPTWALPRADRGPNALRCASSPGSGRADRHPPTTCGRHQVTLGHGRMLEDANLAGDLRTRPPRPSSGSRGRS
jgi:hypothetical protein